jgi:hypothetical protein
VPRVGSMTRNVTWLTKVDVKKEQLGLILKCDLSWQCVQCDPQDQCAQGSQCDLEVLFHSTQVVIKTSKVARHIGFVQCEHPAQARKGEHSPRCLELKTPT